MKSFQEENRNLMLDPLTSTAKFNIYAKKVLCKGKSLEFIYTINIFYADIFIVINF